MRSTNFFSDSRVVPDPPVDVSNSTPVFSLLEEPLERVCLLFLCLFTGLNLTFELVFQDSQAPLTLLCHDLDFASVVNLT